MDLQPYKDKYVKNIAQEKVVELENLFANPPKGIDMSSLSNDLSYYSNLSFKTSQIQKAMKDLEDAMFMAESSLDRKSVV